MPFPAALGAWIALNALGSAPPPPDPVIIQTGVPATYAYAAGYRAAQEEAQNAQQQKQREAFAARANQIRQDEDRAVQATRPHITAPEADTVVFDETNRDMSWKEKATLSSASRVRYALPSDGEETISFSSR